MEKQRNSHIYEGFAYSYDLFMDNIPYDTWADYLQGLLVDCGVIYGSVLLELGCGTGNMTRRMAKKGYRMIGVDRSMEMLDIAWTKGAADLVLVLQDMREIEMYDNVDAMYCVCDGMNYLLEPQDLRKVLGNATTILEPGGVFIFDLKTPYFYREILGNRTITENREEASMIWENEYHEDTAINEYLLTIYLLEDEQTDLFSRCDEIHYQKAYELQQVKDMIREAGLELVALYDAFTREPPRETSERVYFITRKQYQGGNGFV